VEQRVRTWEELNTFAQPGSEFGLAKAALALAGFAPRFHAGPGFRSLEAQLQDFGGAADLCLHLGFGQTDNGKARQTIGKMHFDRDGRGTDTGKRATMEYGKRHGQHNADDGIVHSLTHDGHIGA